MDIVVVGDSGLADETIWLAKMLGHNVLECVVDTGFSIKKDTKSWDWLQNNNAVKAVIAIGNPAIKHRMHWAVKKICGQDCFTNLISPHAIIAPGVKLGSGNIIQSGVIISPDVEIGDHCLLNLHVTIGHGAKIGSFVTLNPGANISGNVKIFDGAFVGTGAQILEKLTLGTGCVIGAGAVVTRDAQAQKTYVGVPARDLDKKEKN